MRLHNGGSFEQSKVSVRMTSNARGWFPFHAFAPGFGRPVAGVLQLVWQSVWTTCWLKIFVSSDSDTLGTQVSSEWLLDVSH